MEIPEFEILGRIGGGSYGEVFLARSVTGSYRAVKVVRREDFERERTFEREFEGIQRYEKVSQNHPGLVDVLHVGRNDGEGYYYYVMELADDVTSGPEIDVENYEPRTLSSDLKRHRLRSVEECVKVGVPLSEALGHLHAAGLTHRDVKPSNIIFVQGAAKLADVGLVASSGQRTFVGTEGYVPPEGPGTSSADLYSLAMVLYEMGTGKDRLDFPELPTNMELPPTVNRDEWRALNAIICRAGAPDARRRFESGAALSAALKNIVDKGATRPGTVRRRVIAVVSIILLTTLGAFGYHSYREGMLASAGPPQNPPPDPGPTNTGESTNSAANSNGQGSEGNQGSNASSSSTDPSTSVSLSTGDNGGTTTPPPPPFAGAQGNALPNAFDIGANSPSFGITGSGGSVSDTGLGSGDGPRRGVIISDVPIGPPPAPPKKSDPPPPPKAWIRITQPPGASVWAGDRQVAETTPTDYIEFPPGPISLVLKAPGYHDYVLSRKLEPDRRVIEGDIQMIPDRAPVESEPWKNSVDIEFIPLGSRHISREPIGRAIFQRFLEETNYPIDPSSLRSLPDDGLSLNDEHAVWAFCDWMTKIDRTQGYLGSDRFHHPQKDAGNSLAFFSRIEDKFGSVVLNSEPSGASIYAGGRYLGRTPLTLEDQRIGQVRMTLKMPGYREAIADIEVRDADLTPETVTLTRDDSVLFTESWTNGLGMSFVPVRNFMASAFETRVEDYQAFLKTEPEGAAPAKVGFEQGPGHPVAGVNLSEAKAFSAWLTKKERAEGLIQDYHEYRVPSDLQWSAMAGLDSEEGNTPEDRDIRKSKDEFPWGDTWPPPGGSGNFADASARNTLSRVIKGFEDAFEKTAPVGSFDPNPYEIYDLAGNVWEWIDEPYGGPEHDSYYFVRGGGYSSAQRGELLTGYRLALRADFKGQGGALNGFRCVLVDTRITP